MKLSFFISSCFLADNDNHIRRPDTLDPALLRPGRIDRRIEFSLPDAEGRAHILRIHARSMSTERNIRFDLISRLCPNTTGAELRSVCTEAGMFAIRQRRKVASEKDFLDAVEKVIRQGSKFSSSSVSIIRLRRGGRDLFSYTDGRCVSCFTALSTIQLDNTDVSYREERSTEFFLHDEWIAKQCYNVSYNVVLQVQGF
jgi:hypothetical protein